MVFPALVIGSGPCGAACFAKLRELGVDAWLIDHGRLPAENTTLLAGSLQHLPAAQWPVIKVHRSANGQNLKTWLGDDFSTNDSDSVYSVKTALKASHAFGGLSWVWGCSVARWDDLSTLPAGISRAYDWLDRKVPVVGSSALSTTAQRWQHRAQAAVSPLTASDPQLTIDAARCLRCGMCMGGCPLRATWIAADWVRSAAPSERTLLGWRVDRVQQNANDVEVHATSSDGAHQCWRAKEVFVAAGAAGSAAIALGSNPGMERVRLLDPRYVMGFTLLSGGIAALHGEEDDHALAKLKLTDHRANIYWQAYTRMPQIDILLGLGLSARLGERFSRRLGILQGFLAPGAGSDYRSSARGRGLPRRWQFRRRRQVPAARRHRHAAPPAQGVGIIRPARGPAGPRRRRATCRLRPADGSLNRPLGPLAGTGAYPLC